MGEDDKAENCRLPLSCSCRIGIPSNCRTPADGGKNARFLLQHTTRKTFEAEMAEKAESVMVGWASLFVTMNNPRMEKSPKRTVTWFSKREQESLGFCAPTSTIVSSQSGLQQHCCHCTRCFGTISHKSQHLGDANAFAVGREPCVVLAWDMFPYGIVGNNGVNCKL